MSFTPIGPPVIHNIYCEAQGPHVAKLENDHVTSMLLTGFVESGEPDGHGGRKLVTLQGLEIVCKICGAPLRRFEVK